jgi:hypothetical protein
MRGKAVSFSILLLISNSFNAWAGGLLGDLVSPSVDRQIIDNSVQNLDRLNSGPQDNQPGSANSDPILIPGSNPNPPGNLPTPPLTYTPPPSNPYSYGSAAYKRALPQAYKTCQTPEGSCPLNTPALSGTTCFCDLGGRVFGIAR